MNVPEDLLYTKEHEWARVEGGFAFVGITDYAQDQLGDIVYLDLPCVGATVTQKKKMGEVESVKAVSELYSPVSGEVVEVNQEAVDNPELVNKDAYGEGWLLKVQLSNLVELEELLNSQGYKKQIQESQDEEVNNGS